MPINHNHKYNNHKNHSHNHKKPKVSYFDLLRRKKKPAGGLSLKRPLEYKLVYGISISCIAFLTAFISSSILAPVEVTDAAEVLSALSATDSSVSISTTASTIDLSLATGSSGAVRTASDVVTVTAGSTGYQLYIGTNGSNNALIRDGATPTGTDSSTGASIYAEADTIPASLATSISSPDVLSNDTWGFAVPASVASQ